VSEREGARVSNLGGSCEAGLQPLAVLMSNPCVHAPGSSRRGRHASDCPMGRYPINGDLLQHLAVDTLEARRPAESGDAGSGQGERYESDPASDQGSRNSSWPRIGKAKRHRAPRRDPNFDFAEKFLTLARLLPAPARPLTGTDVDRWSIVGALDHKRGITWSAYQRDISA
jgi:hypothetical protein